MTSVRVYSGLGQLTQSHTLNAELYNGTKNVVVGTVYDKYGRAVKQTKPFTYAGGSFSSQNLNSKAGTETVYDDWGRVTSVTEPNGNQVTNEYTELLVITTDPKNHTTETQYDVWGKALSVTPATGPGLTYEYDTVGRLTSVTKGSEANATTTSIGYDLSGRKTSMTDPDMGAWSYVYNAVGGLTSQTDARGCSTSLGYDALNRLTGKSYSGAGACDTTADVTYTYDQGTNGIGRRTYMSDGSGSTTWTYDQRGRKLNEVKAINAENLSTESFTTSWTYNKADLPITMTYPDGEVLNLGYNDQGLLEDMINTSAFTYIKNLTYDEAGRVTGLGMGDVSSTAVINRAYSYNEWSENIKGGLLNSLTATNIQSSSLQDLTYDYDRNGNISSIVDAVAVESSAFSYDTLDRLTGMTVTHDATPIHAEEFVYDEAGRMESKDGQAFTYDASHPHAVIALESGSYAYDANGNQVTRSLAEGMFTLVYDGENRLVQVDAVTPPTATPTVTATPTETATETVTETPTETATPDGTLTEIPTETATETATETPTETATATETPTETSTTDPLVTPSDTPEVSATPTETATETPTETATDTETPIPSETPTPTETPTLEFTATETTTPTMTETPTITGTATTAGTPTATAIPTEPAPEALQNASYIYDGDGNLVKSVINGKSTYFLGKLYQKKIEGATTTVQKYYSSGSAQVAVRTISGASDTIQWMLSDHLGSTSTTANADGTWNSSISFSAFGEIRASSGITNSNFRYTGQLRQAELGLYYYVARWYDPQTAHFTQADTIVQNQTFSGSYDRYAYVMNNPIRYTDPTGNACRDDGYCVIMPGDRVPNQTKSFPVDPVYVIRKSYSSLIDKLVDYTVSIISKAKSSEQRKEIRANIELIFSQMEKGNSKYTEWNNNSSPWNSASLAYLFATIRKESLWGLDMFELKGESKIYAPYYGRGFIHLTSEDSYSKMAENFNVDLLSDPDLVANNKELSARISLRFVVLGMAGYSLGEIKSPDDFYTARNLVNPGDNDDIRNEVANWADGYYQIINNYCNLGQLSSSGSCY